MTGNASPLVFIFLRGGLDGLSMLRPVGDDTLERLRGDLAVPAEQMLPLDGTFGLHPSMPRTAARFAQGSVALVPATGLPTATRSHFAAQYALERCDDGDAAVPGGWLGRHLAATAGDAVAPLRGVSLGQPQLPTLLSGSTDVLAARSLGDIRLGTDGDVPTVDDLRGLWEGDAGPLGPSSIGAFDALRAVAGVTAPGDGPVDEIVSLFGSDLGTQIAVINVGGWDDHSDLGPLDGRFSDRAAALDGMVEALLADVEDVTVVIGSEFGRRVASNASGGCDHGRGGLMVVAGSRVQGGVHGDWPGLATLDDGDVPITTDVRTVLAEVTERVLGSDPDQILPGAPTDRLGLFV